MNDIVYNERRRIAKLLNFNPDASETWPLAIIDNIIGMAKRAYDKEVEKQVFYLMNRY